jgi:hypothetical protein
MIIYNHIENSIVIVNYKHISIVTVVAIYNHIESLIELEIERVT